MRTSEIKNIAKANLKNKFGISLLSQVMGMAVTSVAQYIPFAGSIVTGPMDVGVAKVFIDGSEGRKAEFKDIFAGFRKNFGENFLHGLVKDIFLSLWTLLLVIPGIVKSYSYAMSEYLLAKDSDLSAMDAITASRRLMKGHKWELFVLNLSFLGWDLLTVLTLGFAGIYTMPYKKAAKIAFFNAINEEVQTA